MIPKLLFHTKKLLSSMLFAMILAGNLPSYTMGNSKIQSVRTTKSFFRTSKKSRVIIMTLTGTTLVGSLLFYFIYRRKSSKGFIFSKDTSSSSNLLKLNKKNITLKNTRKNSSSKFKKSKILPRLKTIEENKELLSSTEFKHNASPDITTITNENSNSNENNTATTTEKNKSKSPTEVKGNNKDQVVQIKNTGKDYSRKKALGKSSKNQKEKKKSNIKGQFVNIIRREEKDLDKKVKKHIKAFFKDSQAYKYIDPIKRKILQKLTRYKSTKSILNEFEDLQMTRFKIKQKDLDKIYNEKKITKSEFLEELIKLVSPSVGYQEKCMDIVEKEGFQYPAYYNINNLSDIRYSSNFCNKEIGGDLWRTFAQEESLMLLSCFIILKKYLSTSTEYLASNEIAILEAFPIFGEFNADQVYAEEANRIEKMLKIVKERDIVKHINLLCLDAPSSPRNRNEEYTQKEVKHLLNKLFIAGITLIEGNRGKKSVMLEFGNWGGGSFKNNLIVVYILTIIMVHTLRIRYKDSGLPNLILRIHPMDMGIDKLSKALSLVTISVNSRNDKPFSIMELWEQVKEVAKNEQKKVVNSKEYKDLKASIENLKNQKKQKEATRKQMELKKMEYNLNTSEQCSHAVK